jgi:hypothetical protein
MGRWSLAFGIAATLLTSALGPPASVAAQSLEVARLQVVVKEIKIHDDREGLLSGQGEMNLSFKIWSCPEWDPLPCLDRQKVGFIAGGEARFNASTGDTVTLDRVVPQAGDSMYGADTGPEIGFPVYVGYQYLVRFYMEESDGGWSDLDKGNEQMGEVVHVLDTGEHGLGIGSHTARSIPTEAGRGLGDYTITYDIRRAPVPDLNPGGIRVFDLPGSPMKRVCMGVANIELADAGPFEVALYVDYDVPPGGRITAGPLAMGTGREWCVEVQLPTTGQHQLKVVVDEPRAVAEFNETNNVYTDTYTAAASTSTSTSTSASTPSSATADLTVGAIKVNGQAPDGKDDCKDGKNGVTVVVKNAGKGDADSFAVRLGADGGDIGEQTVSGLEAGQEREVRFDDVRLKKGEHQLTVTVDPKNMDAESTADNTELKITVRCNAA